MSEKRGETEKLLYEFNSAGCLEVLKDGTWFRVTGKEFRSFDGERRITEPVTVELGNVNVPMRTYEYFGPVYMFGTNKIQKFTNSGNLLKGKIWEENRKISESRG